MSKCPLLEWTEEDKIAKLNLYNKTLETIRGDVEEIKEWIKTQPHLPETPSDTFIEHFLILNNCNVESFQEKLDLYYSARTIIPEMYRDPNEPEMHNMMDSWCLLPLPKLTKNLERVWLSKVLNSDTSRFDPLLLLINLINVYEILYREDFVQHQIAIVDCAGMAMGHLTKVSPKAIKKLAFFVEKLDENVQKSIYFINAPMFLHLCLIIVKQVVKKSKKLEVLKSLEALYNVVPKEYLPKDYGGDQKSVLEMTDDWKKAFAERKSFFDERTNLKVNEDLRPAKKSK